MAKIFTDNDFEQEVLKSETPVLVDFYADWCGPCKMMAPVIDSLAEKFEGRVKVGKLNVDDSPNSAAKYRVMSIPTIILFQNGEPVETVVGALTEDELSDKINSKL